MPYSPQALQRIKQLMMGRQPQQQGTYAPPPHGPPSPIEEMVVKGRPPPPVPMTSGITPPPKMAPIEMPSPGSPNLGGTQGMAQGANAAPTQSGGAPPSSFGGQSPFEGLPPELIGQVIGLGDNDMLRKQLDEQMMQAQALRSQPVPQGIQAGRVYVASNPLAHAGRAWAGYRGKKQQDKIRGEQQALGREEVEARKRMFESLMRQRGGNGPATPGFSGTI